MDSQGKLRTLNISIPNIPSSVPFVPKSGPEVIAVSTSGQLNSLAVKIAAKACKRNGMKVILLAPSLKKAIALQSKFKALVHVDCKTFACRLDITNKTSIKEFVQWVLDEVGFVDVLINDVYLRDAPLDSTPPKKVLYILRHNLFGQMDLIDAFVPLLRNFANVVVVLHSQAFTHLRTLDQNNKQLFNVFGKYRGYITNAILQYIEKAFLLPKENFIQEKDVEAEAWNLSQFCLMVLCEAIADELYHRGIHVNGICALPPKRKKLLRRILETSSSVDENSEKNSASDSEVVELGVSLSTIDITKCHLYMNSSRSFPYPPFFHDGIRMTGNVHLANIKDAVIPRH
eukprot:CAMPEP_0167769506 /NCGR_PEP_ID=MMETSP0110_2-20121227/17338_1 /TAXON_ID=629695 /ORGANISM="Gymnochlora sp., Strain CCMP2014" /LENGTH=343 /DNA_ID=CAMNT_0007658453 /DNA_START=96 /DNA_END=1127 /DNA_ORIENTATION=+